MELSKRMRNWDWIHKGVDFSHVDGWADKVEQLETINADLLEALKQIHNEFVLRDVGENDALDEIATEAIRKAEEQIR